MLYLSEESGLFVIVFASGELRISGQVNMTCGHSAPRVCHICVMLPGGIHGGVAQHIRYKIDIAGFLVQIGGICAAKLVRTDLLFQRRCDSSVFFHQVLYSALGDPLPLQAEEKCVFMARKRFNLHPFIQVFAEGISDFRREVKHYLIAAFPCDQESVVFHIQVIQVDSDAFTDADSGTQEKAWQNRVLP